MLRIKVWCLPANLTEGVLRQLHQEMVNAVVSIPELGLKDQNDMVTLFPTDMMKYGLGEEIIVEVEVAAKYEHTPETKQRLAANLGFVLKTHFPQAKVEVGPVRTLYPTVDAFWSSETAAPPQAGTLSDKDRMSTGISMATGG